MSSALSRGRKPAKSGYSRVPGVALRITHLPLPSFAARRRWLPARRERRGPGVDHIEPVALGCPHGQAAGAEFATDGGPGRWSAAGRGPATDRRSKADRGRNADRGPETRSGRPRETRSGRPRETRSGRPLLDQTNRPAAQGPAASASRRQRASPGAEVEMSDPQVLSFRPEVEQYAWTFGGAAPVARIKPGIVLELWTEDCFAGRVRSKEDLVSQVCEFPFLNPQTGPFHVEGAEPGDTLAVHFVSIDPSREWAASTTVPLFGALTSTHLTATLQDPLPEVVWIWELDRAKGSCQFTARV